MSYNHIARKNMSRATRVKRLDKLNEVAVNDFKFAKDMAENTNFMLPTRKRGRTSQKVEVIQHESKKSRGQSALTGEFNETTLK